MKFISKEWFYALCIFLIPLSVGMDLPGGASISFPGELMLAVLAGMVAFQILSNPLSYKKLLLHPLTLLLLAEFIWMLISSFFSELPMVSLKRVIMKGIFLTSLFVFTIQWAEKDANKIKYLFLYALGLIIPVVYSEFRHYWLGMDFLVHVSLCKPFFDEHTIYGAAIAFVIPFVAVAAGNTQSLGIDKKYRLWIFALLILLVAGEYFAYSRAGVLSLMSSVILYFFLKLNLQFKHLLIGLAWILSLTFVFRSEIYSFTKSVSYQSNTADVGEHLLSALNLDNNVSNLERVNRWKCAVRMFEERPITGFGPGTFQFVYGPFQKPDEMTRISTTKGDKGNAHSEIFMSLSETGLPGLLLNLILIFTVIGIAMRAYYKSKNIVAKKVVMAALLGFVTSVVHGLFNSFLDQDKIASLVFTSMAIIVTVDLSTRENKIADEKNL